MVPDLRMLAGEALRDNTSIKRYAVSDLPTDAEPRFAALFRERPRWEWADLEPYVQGLQVRAKGEGAWTGREVYGGR